MGWLRLVGSLKLYVSFAKEPYKIDCILQQRPIILRSLLIVATQYQKTALYIFQTSSTSTHFTVWVRETLHHIISHQESVQLGAHSQKSAVYSFRTVENVVS